MWIFFKDIAQKHVIKIQYSTHFQNKIYNEFQVQYNSDVLYIKTVYIN